MPEEKVSRTRITLDGSCDNKRIRVGKQQYLVQVYGHFYLGTFSRHWYGLSFNGWGSSGIQLDSNGLEAVWTIKLPKKV